MKSAVLQSNLPLLSAKGLCINRTLPVLRKSACFPAYDPCVDITSKQHKATEKAPLLRCFCGCPKNRCDWRTISMRLESQIVLCPSGACANHQFHWWLGFACCTVRVYCNTCWSYAYLPTDKIMHFAERSWFSEDLRIPHFLTFCKLLVFCHITLAFFAAVL